MIWVFGKYSSKDKSKQGKSGFPRVCIHEKPYRIILQRALSQHG
ncbi:hypothetical protein HMPREF1869_01050 [Bacteroidales bacterium KA00251]|nr:hypothetical protein HMPREF1869_01050 [Bacteroidales bacterium KA00251]